MAALTKHSPLACGPTDAPFKRRLLDQYVLPGRIPVATGHDDVLASAAVYSPLTEHYAKPGFFITADLSGGHGYAYVAMG